LWAIARTSQRAAIENREAVPGDQIDCVISSKTELGALFTGFFLNAGLLLLVKWQAKSLSKYPALLEGMKCAL
jgi:hypothetical protein